MADQDKTMNESYWATALTVAGLGVMAIGFYVGDYAVIMFGGVATGYGAAMLWDYFR